MAKKRAAKKAYKKSESKDCCMGNKSMDSCRMGRLCNMFKCKSSDKTGSSCGSKSGGCCGTYMLAALGAAVYYISTATGFWNGVWGVIKALAWPATLLFELLKFLGA